MDQKWNILEHHKSQNKILSLVRKAGNLNQHKILPISISKVEQRTYKIISEFNFQFSK